MDRWMANIFYKFYDLMGFLSAGNRFMDKVVRFFGSCRSERTFKCRKYNNARSIMFSYDTTIIMHYQSQLRYNERVKRQTNTLLLLKIVHSQRIGAHC